MAKTYYFKNSDGHIFVTENPDFYKTEEQLSQTAGKSAYRQQVIRELKKQIKPGSTVYTKLESVSKSGMSRKVHAYIVTKDKRVERISYQVGVITGSTYAADGSVVCYGCGMDAGYHLVHTLGHYLWPKGTSKPHGIRDGEPDTDGGYALKHEWI